VEKRDRYGRLLSYVYLSDGRMLNEDIVNARYARLMTIPPNVKYEPRLLKAYREAREARKEL
jgi:micrococcal nuclease